MLNSFKTIDAPHDGACGVHSQILKLALLLDNRSIIKANLHAVKEVCEKHPDEKLIESLHDEEKNEIHERLPGLAGIIQILQDTNGPADKLTIKWLKSHVNTLLEDLKAPFDSNPIYREIQEVYAKYKEMSGSADEELVDKLFSERVSLKEDFSKVFGLFKDYKHCSHDAPKYVFSKEYCRVFLAFTTAMKKLAEEVNVNDLAGKYSDEVILQKIKFDSTFIISKDDSLGAENINYIKLSELYNEAHKRAAIDTGYDVEAFKYSLDRKDFLPGYSHLFFDALLNLNYGLLGLEIRYHEKHWNVNVSSIYDLPYKLVEDLKEAMDNMINDHKFLRSFQIQHFNDRLDDLIGFIDEEEDLPKILKAAQNLRERCDAMRMQIEKIDDEQQDLSAIKKVVNKIIETLERIINKITKFLSCVNLVREPSSPITFSRLGYSANSKKSSEISEGTSKSARASVAS